MPDVAQILKRQRSKFDKFSNVSTKTNLGDFFRKVSADAGEAMPDANSQKKNCVFVFVDFPVSRYL
jgi:hypothetical protein